MANRRMKRCSTSGIIREIQIKTTMRYHLTPARKLTSATQETTAVGKDMDKGTLWHCWWECTLVQLLWKIVWMFVPQKVKNRTTLQSSNYTTRCLPKELKKNPNSKGYMHPDVYSNIIYNKPNYGMCPSVHQLMNR